SPTAPMVLGSQEPGRVGRRRFISPSEPPARRLVAFTAPARVLGSACALDVQFAAWRAELGRGAERVGCKLGMGARVRSRDGPVEGLPEAGVDASLIIAGERAAAGPSAADFSQRMRAAAPLREMGEGLRSSD